jgi:hypothetical protein
MKKLLYLMSLVSIFSLFACNSFVSDPFPTDATIPKDLKISLEKEALGMCDSFQAAVNAQGKISFQMDEKCVQEKEKFEDQVSEENLQELIKTFKHAKFFNFENTYNEDSNCPESSTDGDYLTTSIRINGQNKTVKHYLNCYYQDKKEVFPRELTSLENKIHEIIFK